MVKDSQLRITTWPTTQVRLPRVGRFPGAELHREMVHLGPEWELVEVPDQLRLFELRDVDLDDPEAMVQVVRHVGTVAPVNLSSDLAVDGVGKVTRHSKRCGRSFDVAQHRDFGETMKALRRTDGPHVHLDELAYRLALLRALNEHVIAHSRRLPTTEIRWPGEGPRRLRVEIGDWRHFAVQVNAALRPFQVRVHVALGNKDMTPMESPGLFSVAVLQLVNDLTTHATYQVCEAEYCGRMFVRQRGRRVHYSRSTGSIYCTKSCMNAQTQRNYRRRQRAERKEEA